MLKIQTTRLLVQQAQHHAFTVARGQGRYAHVNSPTGDPQRDAAILRQAFFGNIETRHDLDARYQQRGQHPLRFEHLAQDAIDTEAHDQAIFEGFDMNIRGVFLDRLGQQGIDEADDRRIILTFQQVFRLGKLLGDAEQVHALAEITHHLHGFAGILLIGDRQQVLEVLVIDELQTERLLHEAAQFHQRQ